MSARTAVYVLWLRALKRFWRSKSQIIGSIAMPLFFLGFLGLGLNRMAVPGVAGDGNYLRFLVPGIIGMSLLFSSTFAGLSVLWDREFGFLKEIMVAPVSRVSIVLGRIAGGSTTSLIQSVMILIISLFLGFAPASLWGVAASALFMVLISFTFISIGLIFASNMHDIHGFTLVMNFLVFPLFLLSGALFPVENLPEPVRVLSYLDPLTYGVDGLRGTLAGVSSLPLAQDLAVLALFSFLFIVLGAWFFERCEC